jgi:hypothetical protein
MPKLTVKGERILRGEKSFTPYGFGYLGDGRASAVEYLEHPSDRRFRAVAANLAEMRSYGANTVRIVLELPTFVHRPHHLHQESVAALQRLLRRAERLDLYLVMLGNVTLRPYLEGSDWYERLAERRRWRVQAEFFGDLAAALRGDPAVAWYELANEPVVPTRAVDRWYCGQMGDYWFGQYLVRDLHGRDPDLVVRAWIRSLRGAIDRQDPKALVSVGLLSFTHPTWGLRPTNVARELDLLTVHEYPIEGRAEASVALMREWGQVHKPVVLGETMAYVAGVETFTQFLLGSKPYLQGFMTNYNGLSPKEYNPDDSVEVLNNTSLKAFLAIRSSLKN